MNLLKSMLMHPVCEKHLFNQILSGKILIKFQQVCKYTYFE